MPSILIAQGAEISRLKRLRASTICVEMRAWVEDDRSRTIQFRASTIERPDLSAVETLHLGGLPILLEHIFGPVTLQASLKCPDDIGIPYLIDRWLPSSYEDGKLLYLFIRAVSALGNKRNWMARSTLGFQEVDVNGKMEKRFCRLVRFDMDDKVLEKRLVYDFMDMWPKITKNASMMNWEEKYRKKGTH